MTRPLHPVNQSRRLLIKGGLASASLFLPVPYALVWAQSEGTLKLLKLPKIALVLGNSKYKSAPLQNPANDARAMAETLKTTGFDVTLRMDAGRDDMVAAVQGYAKALAATKGVGLFYYAGHGIQLAWRNYMLPVDADLGGIADIQKHGVEVNALLAGISKAANAMNIIILDACRDNPFGELKGIEQKGLSQMDAPNGTLLAYATSPGNVASDGEGANGLYTENLLREIRVPEAKVEEVFKRVRLGVRLKSRGAQIPWESTSLEEDFWFVPPKSLAVIAEDEARRQRERQYQQELAIWEKAKSSKGPEAFQDYLLRYPSGRFSELAQLRLDQELARIGEKKILIASSQGNPFTKGSATANVGYQIGDSYTYRTLDLFSKVEQGRNTETVSQITSDTVIFSSGLILDLLGNPVRWSDGRLYGPNQVFPLEFAVGKRWISRYQVSSPGGRPGETEREFRITTREQITVPAGTFNAFVVVGYGFTRGTRPDGRPIELSTKGWFAPDFSRRPIAAEETRKAGSTILSLERRELVSFKQG